jgi:hypothetical protein
MTMLSRPGLSALFVNWRARPSVEHRADFLGKRVLVTQDQRTTTVEELRAHLARFNLAWTLRRIGALDAALHSKGPKATFEHAIPPHALPYVALVAVEASSDDVLAVPDEADVMAAVGIFNCLQEPSLADLSTDRGVFESLIRMGHSQLSGRGDTLHDVARTWMLFEQLWPRVTQAAHLDVNAAIRRETGLSLLQFLMFGFALSQHGTPGYMGPYTPEALAKLPCQLGAGPAEQEAFLNWASASYDEVRQLAAKDSVEPAYKRYALSPFLLKPIVRPDRLPAVGAEHVRLVPVPRYLIRRVTLGLYHALATASHQGNKQNAFRVAFGFVFQDYVGQLLRAGSGKAKVFAEWEFGPKRARIMTPDWMVLDNGRLLIIEVKQSALTIISKTYGKFESVVRDLRKTLTDGVRKLLEFAQAVESQTSGLERVSEATEVELLLITHDEVPWGNWIIRDAIAQEVPGAEAVHICSIGEFEQLQRHCWGTSPLELLKCKRNGLSDEHKYDLDDWLSAIPGPAADLHPVLSQSFSGLRKAWGVPEHEGADAAARAVVPTAFG